MRNYLNFNQPSLTSLHYNQHILRNVKSLLFLHSKFKRKDKKKEKEKKGKDKLPSLCLFKQNDSSLI